jgi:TonB family protein
MKSLVLFICFFLSVQINTFAQHDNNVYQEFEVSQNAEFPEGVDNFRKLLSQNLQYPNSKKKVTVVLSFLVNEQGKIEQVKVIKKGGDEYDKAAINAITEVNKNYTWKPALNSNGKVVKVRKTIPIKFE